MFMNSWATPKRVQMEKFVALSPQDQTILGGG